MEELPPWPASIFDTDPTTIEMTRTGLAVINNIRFITTINKWRVGVEIIKLDVDTETEGAQMDPTLVREFLNIQPLMEPRVIELKTICKKHLKSMSETWKKVNNIKLKEFFKTYNNLSEEVKGYIKEECRRFTNHICNIRRMAMLKW